MKREILFRGKRIDNGEWVEGSLFNNTTTPKIIVVDNINMKVFYHEVDTSTLGQFTGELDRIGKHIFEGDRFRLGAEPEVYEVKFEYGCFMAFKDGKQYGLIGELINAFIEVIGNIFDK